jgi:RNA polymerase sigma-70 factor, ECF subfamily
MGGIRDEEFVKALVEYQSDIYGFISTLLMFPSWHDADDIFQQTSLILWQKREQFDRSLDFLRWACGIARNEVRNFVRRQSPRRTVFSDELIDNLADVRLDAQPVLEQRRALLAQCAEKLDLTARRLLQRCYAGRSSIQAVARQFHLTPNAVYLRLRRIRRELMECIQRGMDEGDTR